MRYILLSVPLLLSACATLTARDDYIANITTVPAGASCILKNEEGIYHVPQTPGTAAVKRSFSPLLITCNKAMLQASKTLAAETRNRAYGNILLGGVPALADAASGYGYTYPEAPISLTLEKPKISKR